ncbi:glycerol kinase GlpK [Marinibacterium profundimaris]|uniref:Glycerol kinase n=1 Tax=Marinibacterium profundimaris TaxID=1679460 RepID=A0A225NPT9_9RHOB|nr:glycerol kinase GlpK [Marinibacterium profundimaris]OWU75900.1 glycerol kinase [Marinibacterium profundimaris]
MSHIVAIDQGTTSSRAIVFDSKMRPVASAQQEFPQYYPASGHVEHDPEEIWDSVEATLRQAVEKAGLNAADIAGIGITNQRETTLVWERDTGKCLGRAIVWQDRRTAAFCAKLRDEGHEDLVASTAGLLLDPYFSATKLAWILDQHDGSRERAAKGELLFGTVDSFLIWRLTGGKRHVTEATNASRTALFDIDTQDWSPELCKLFGIPMEMLPEVLDCAAEFGETELLGAPVRILGVAGDQQAATLGQACFQPGMMKSTYGTGCFALMNTGPDRVSSQNRLLTTVAYRLDGQVTYALEGSIFIAGAVVQWLRDALQIIGSADESGPLAEAADAAQGVTLVPAFTGLGAPYWAPDCRGAVFGLTRGSGRAEFARAALESVAFQTRDLWEAMRADGAGSDDTVLRVDGGMVASDWTMQRLSDVLGAPVDRPVMAETTALGAAWLAGMRAGVYPDAEGFAAMWALDRRFEPQSDEDSRTSDYARWKRAVDAALAF